LRFLPFNIFRNKTPASELRSMQRLFYYSLAACMSAELGEHKYSEMLMKFTCCLDTYPHTPYY